MEGKAEGRIHGVPGSIVGMVIGNGVNGIGRGLPGVVGVGVGDWPPATGGCLGGGVARGGSAAPGSAASATGAGDCPPGNGMGGGSSSRSERSHALARSTSANKGTAPGEGERLMEASGTLNRAHRGVNSNISVVLLIVLVRLIG